MILLSRLPRNKKPREVVPGFFANLFLCNLEAYMHRGNDIGGDFIVRGEIKIPGEEPANEKAELNIFCVIVDQAHIELITHSILIVHGGDFFIQPEVRIGRTDCQAVCGLYAAADKDLMLVGAGIILVGAELGARVKTAAGNGTVGSGPG